MITWILAGVIFGAAGTILFRKFMKMKSGDFSCEGCKGGSCSGCKTEIGSPKKITATRECGNEQLDSI